MTKPLAKMVEQIDAQFAKDVVAGLSHAQKSISCTWLYDQRGCELFEQITTLDEYYPTRTETRLLRDVSSQLAQLIGPGATVVEIGAGAVRKTRILLSALRDPQAYIAVDIAAEFVLNALALFRQEFPSLRCTAVAADFNSPRDLKRLRQKLPPGDGPRVGFFPGSTIGNLTPEAAIRFLRTCGEMLGPQAWMIVGLDSTRDAARLIPAYDDAQGVTAAFNLNVLERINRELGGDFLPERFRHEARFDATHGRVEMHLVSQDAQVVKMLGHTFLFAPGETIHTENSYKFEVAQFKAMADRAGWRHCKVWLDMQLPFGIHLLCNDRVVHAGRDVT